MKLSEMLSNFHVTEADRLRAMQFQEGMQRMRWMALIVHRGGNIHGVNHRATARRRAANKVARKQRKINAHNA